MLKIASQFNDSDKANFLKYQNAKKYNKLYINLYEDQFINVKMFYSTYK